MIGRKMKFWFQTNHPIRRQAGHGILEIIIAFAILSIIVGVFVQNMTDNVKLRKQDEIRANLARELDPLVRRLFEQHYLPQLNNNCLISQPAYAGFSEGGSQAVVMKLWKSGPSFFVDGLAAEVRKSCQAKPMAQQSPWQKQQFICGEFSNLRALSSKDQAEARKAYVHFSFSYYPLGKERKLANRLSCSAFISRTEPANLELFYQVFWRDTQRKVFSYSNSINYSNFKVK
jgi:hypothetical protein